jgi:predicted transcriptional regulator
VITREWTFLSNHGHVLVCLADESGVRLRDVAERVGITERSVQHIVRDLEEAGYVVTERVGRRNRYKVVRSGRFRHPLEGRMRVGQFTDLVLGSRTSLVANPTGSNDQLS